MILIKSQKITSEYRFILKNTVSYLYLNTGEREVKKVCGKENDYEKIQNQTIVGFIAGIPSLLIHDSLWRE
jgi:hypothetical protein